MRKYLKDITLVGFILIIGLILYFALQVKKEEGSDAVIYYKNEIHVLINFDKNQIELVTTPKDGYPKIVSETEVVLLGDYVKNNQKTYVYVEVDFINKKVRIKKDDSPYQIAVNRGWYDGNGLPLISAPNSISIIFKKSEVDSSV